MSGTSITHTVYTIYCTFLNTFSTTPPLPILVTILGGKAGLHWGPLPPAPPGTSRTQPPPLNTVAVYDAVSSSCQDNQLFFLYEWY